MKIIGDRQGNILVQQFPSNDFHRNEWYCHLIFFQSRGSENHFQLWWYCIFHKQHLGDWRLGNHPFGEIRIFSNGERENFCGGGGLILLFRPSLLLLPSSFFLLFFLFPSSFFSFFFLLLFPTALFEKFKKGTIFFFFLVFCFNPLISLFELLRNL